MQVHTGKNLYFERVWLGESYDTLRWGIYIISYFSSLNSSLLQSFATAIMIETVYNISHSFTNRLIVTVCSNDGLESVYNDRNKLFEV